MIQNHKIRGQISSIDLLVAILLFVLIFFSMRNIWIDNLSSALIESDKFQLQVLSNEAIDSLLNTPGYPLSWNAQNVELIGLADKQNVINSIKLAQFKSMNYETAKSKLGLGLYEFSFDLNSINSEYNEHIGSNLDSNSNVFSITRKVTYKGVEANVVFKISTN
ncbi:MAG: hypothetical protein WCW44_00860 [archaeon]|jgi:hypothetical protein